MVHLHRSIPKITGISLAAAIMLTGVSIQPALQAFADTPAAQTQHSDVQINVFQQSWNTIAKECRTTYGPEGIGWVEVSPPQESIQGTSWWTSYQPVSYKLDSKLGTQAEFENMITECQAAGVNIIADVVLNQTTGSEKTDGDEQGTAGTTFNRNSASYPGFATSTYPEGITKEDFHTYGNINSYTNQEEVQSGRLLGMWDFNSESEKVQDIQAEYLANLYKLGVRGFRMDAAKHIQASSLGAIKEKMAQKVNVPKDNIYWIQETIGNTSEAPEIQPVNYLGNGTVTQFGYRARLKQAFYGKLSSLARLGSDLNNDIASDKANVFVTNWDTARDGSALTYKDGARYQLANAFLLAYDYGTPRLHSDYKYGDDQAGHDSGAPNATATRVPDVDFDMVCANNTSEYNCQQRWTSTRGMVAFHNQVAGTQVENWWDNGDQVIAFSRGNKGFIAINNSLDEQKIDVATSLPDGEYCNVYSTLDCSQTIAVRNGKVATTIAPRSAVALHVGATKAQHPVSTVATDPSDPELNEQKDIIRPSDTTITISYKPANNTWTSPQVHYGLNGTWDKPDATMTQGSDGAWHATIETEGKPMEFVFHDVNTDSWENPQGGGNYKAAVGVNYMTVANQTAEIKPTQAPQPQTRLVVHYRAPQGDPNRGVYVWGALKDGGNLNAKNHAFTGTDCWGKVAELTFDGQLDKFGFIITTENWNKYGGDREAIVRADGTAEVWVDGTAHADQGEQTPVETLTAAPADYNCTAAKLTVTAHYRRNDARYFNADDTDTVNPQWDLWTWASGKNGKEAVFTSHDEYGLTSTYTFDNYTRATQSSDQTLSDIGLLRRYGKDKWVKDTDGDHFIPTNAIVWDADGNAHAEVWMVQDDPNIYSARPMLELAMKSASITELKTVQLKFSGDVSNDQVQNHTTLNNADGSEIAIDSIRVDGSDVYVTTRSELPLDEKITVTVDEFGTQTLTAGAVVRTQAFDELYAYNGNDLGATWSEKATSFKLWAPTAQKVELVTFASDQTADAPEASVTPMTRGEKGTWSAKLDGDKRDTAYIYRLTFADGTVSESPDPYATAAVVNGKRSVVLADEQMSIGDVSRMPAFSKPTDAIIAETHVRDFSKDESSGVDEAKRGTFLGMIQEGTTNAKGEPTGLDYIKQLGITHLQIQPMYDYVSVDETKPLDDSNYNWGYDPQNYNVPEGSYSSNASDPKVRIQEAKQMVEGLHKNGIRVIMDVVYNHVADPSTNPFGLTVPGYYFRYNANGNLTSQTGVGNDTASERAMMRKYMVDSVVYWATQYNVDGFRFDLMGIHDVDTMKAIRVALDKIDPSIIIVGEGWNMAGDTLPTDEATTQPNAYKLDNTNENGTKSGSTVGFFNDSIRDGLRGSVFDASAKGFVGGARGNEGLILNNALGCINTYDGLQHCSNGAADTKYASPGQVVQYAEIHDNHTLYDKLKAASPEDSDEVRAQRAMLADAAVFLSQGIAEMQLGQEFLRTKGGDHNSYKSGDSVNAIDWNRKSEGVYKQNAEYVRSLIALRKALPQLHVGSYDEIRAMATPLRADDGVVAWQLKTDKETVVLVLNAQDSAATVTGIEAGDWQQLVAGSNVNLPTAKALRPLLRARRVARATVSAVGAPTVTVGNDGTVLAAALSATVLYKSTEETKDEGTQTEDPDTKDDGTQTETPDSKDENEQTEQSEKTDNSAQKDNEQQSTKQETGKKSQAKVAVSKLAVTGSSVMIFAIVALALLGAGTVLVIVRKRNTTK